MITQRGWTFNPDKPIWDKEVKVGEGEPINRRMVQAYLWSRTIICPNCTALIPLSPTWKLSSRLGLMMVPNQDFKIVQFKVVRAAQMSRGTVKKGIATCPICGTACPQFYPRDEAQADRMGHILYCLVFRDWFPFYRKGRASQGRSPIQFRVANDILPKSDAERYRCLHSLGWLEQAMQSDPIFRDLGLYGDPPSEYAAGLSAMDRACQELADAADGWTNPVWRPNANRPGGNWYDPDRTQYQSAPAD